MWKWFKNRTFFWSLHFRNFIGRNLWQNECLSCQQRIQLFIYFFINILRSKLTRYQFIDFLHRFKKKPKTYNNNLGLKRSFNYYSLMFNGVFGIIHNVLDLIDRHHIMQPLQIVIANFQWADHLLLNHRVFYVIDQCVQIVQLVICIL